MEKIIAQIAENFIKKILENISSGKKLEEIEPILLKNCKETAVKIVEEYIAVLDKKILSDKELRKKCGYSVERKNDKQKGWLHNFGMRLTAVIRLCESSTHFRKGKVSLSHLQNRLLFVSVKPKGV